MPQRSNIPSAISFIVRKCFQAPSFKYPCHYTRFDTLISLDVNLKLRYFIIWRDLETTPAPLIIILNSRILACK